VIERLLLFYVTQKYITHSTSTSMNGPYGGGGGGYPPQFMPNFQPMNYMRENPRNTSVGVGVILLVVAVIVLAVLYANAQKKEILGYFTQASCEGTGAVPCASTATCIGGVCQSLPGGLCGTGTTAKACATTEICDVGVCKPAPSTVVPPAGSSTGASLTNYTGVTTSGGASMKLTGSATPSSPTGSISALTANQSWIYALDAAATPYGHSIKGCQRPCAAASSWVNVPGELTQMDVGATELWGVNKDQSIFRKPLDGLGNWIQVNGGLRQLSVGKTYVYGTNSLDDIYRCPVNAPAQWELVAGKMKEVSVGDTEVWAINPSGALYRGTTATLTPLTAATGPAGVTSFAHISVGKSSVIATDSSNNVYECVLPCSSASGWKKITTPASLKHIDAEYQ
jgi:hypothetical protein